jgi:hypothetical protein
MHIKHVGLTLGSLFVLASLVAADPAKQISKPDHFKTLVNPNCSHCIDESRRRASELRDNDRVLAWIRGKYDGGAIPFRFFLVPYRVISDTYGVFVYDADAGFVRGYEPSLDFTFYGWRNGIMVIQHKDGTLFSALSGKAFDGPRKGQSLMPIPTIETDWGYWLKGYPGTVAYHMYENYLPMNLPAAPETDALATRTKPDRRLNADDAVIGLAIGAAAKAYPISILSTRKLIHDKIGNQELVVLWHGPTKTAAIYAPEQEGDERRIELAADARNPNGFIDRGTSSQWSIEGRAVEGPLKGKTLRWLPAVQCKWFAWAAEYSETKVFSGGPGQVSKSTIRSSKPSPPESVSRRDAL